MRLSNTLLSISLLDEASGQLFTGDFIYPGPLFAFLPNSSLPDYLRTADELVDLIDPAVTMYGAHRAAPPGTPRQTYQDLQDLQQTLRAIKTGKTSGRGFYPITYEVNDSMSLYAEPGWLQRW
jgi:glyoxylase-like metal-dependent hydrolase (beta-lactamase superfamily II)